jgi:hypothetical protein
MCDLLLDSSTDSQVVVAISTYIYRTIADTDSTI